MPGDYAPPLACQFQGSAWARRVLALFGWTVRFQGLPARQGVLIVYPHTSNWDFLVMMLAKWSLGVTVSFWAKAALFRIPLFGRWLVSVGALAVRRSVSQGAVAQATDALCRAKAAQQFLWLGLSPEGTRRYTPGWRSGFYRCAVAADVPLGLVRLDYARREVVATQFIRLSGERVPDMARIARYFEGVQGLRAAQATPIVLLDKSPTHAKGPDEHP